MNNTDISKIETRDPNISDAELAETTTNRWFAAMRAAGSPNKDHQAFYEKTVTDATGKETADVSIVEGVTLTKFFTDLKHFFRIPD